MGLLFNLRFAVQKLRGKNQQCGHTDQISDVPPGSEGWMWCYIDDALVSTP
jgi:hypothetical protein